MTQDLDSAALHALLDALTTDSAQAGEAYESLRLRLIRFFRWNNCPTPEELADIAFDRLAVKLTGAHEPILDPAKFALGIARMMLHEQHARQIREQKMLSLFSLFQANRHHHDEQQQQHEDALNHCLECLSSANRHLLDRYYAGDAAQRIQNRQALAVELSIGINALRNRALRLRKQLEDCTGCQLAKAAGRDGFRPTVTNRHKTIS
jgi:hypothetical protein